MKNKLPNYIKVLTFCLAMSVQLIPEQLIAGPSYGLGRVRQCNMTTGEINDNDGLDFDPSTGGKDAQWVLTNPVCLTVISYAYTSVKTAIYVMNRGCGLPRPPRLFPSIITDLADITRATASIPSVPGCGVYVTAASAAMSSFMGVLASIWDYADNAYNNTKICGNGWYGANPSQYNLRGKNYLSRAIDGYPADINTTQKIVNLCRTDEQITAFPNEYGGRTCEGELSFDKKHYREYFYGGIEVVDDPVNENPCYDPYRETDTQLSTSVQFGSRLSFFDTLPEYQAQRYYMKGFEEGSYNCQMYRIRNNIDPSTGDALTLKRKNDFNEAYQCCLRRSSNYVCINYHGKRKFCKADRNCTIATGGRFVTFSTQSQDRGSKICVKTYSLCPYNFYIGGGSTICDYYKDTGVTTDMLDADATQTCGNVSDVRNADCTMNNKAGKCKNYCQYMTHCVKTSTLYSHNASTASPYMAEACINFAGDSRNRVSFGSGFLQGSMRHFSAPIVQCFKETLENVFHNQAGHSRCLTNEENAGIDITGVCPSGFTYKKGEVVNSESFFQKLQENLSTVIKVALSLAITFYGIKILMGAGEVKKKDMMLFIVKLAIVLYFATGNAWKDTFFDGIYNMSNFMAELVFKIQMPEHETQRDGCQFGNVYTTISEGSGNLNLASESYPEGKSYLAIWDTLDCKLARYLGFGPSASVANIALLVVAGWLIGPLGAYFVAVVFFFAMIMIILVFRAVHIFLASTVGIILLIFISPITITCMLSEKTKSIFNNWLKQLLSFAFQPMILFVYLAIMVSILDKTLLGSARYSGSPPAKTINCSKYCAEENGAVANGVEIGDCNTNNRKVVNPRTDSFECLISVQGFRKFPGLELIGISIPFIFDLFIESPKKKMLTLVRGLILIYFLYKFMDEVPNIASQLFGGAKLPQSTMKISDVFGLFYKTLRGIQKRAGRATSGAASSTKKKIKQEATSRRSKKNVDSSESSGNDGSSSGGDDDK